MSGLNNTKNLGGPVVEIGSYRGATTKCMALATSRDIICADPFIGYGGVDNDLRTFQQQVGDLTNVKHLRMTSGSARRNFLQNSTSFVFIDAVHDYVDTTFDIEAWWPSRVSGAFWRSTTPIPQSFLELAGPYSNTSMVSSACTHIPQIW